MYQRLYGPYETRGRFQIHAYYLDGRKKYLTFATEIEAEEFLTANRCKVIADPINLKDAVKNYVESRSDLRESSRATLKFRLEALIRDHETVLVAIFPARRTWEVLVKTNAVDTLHGLRSAARGFFEWCVERRYLKKNPFEGVKIVGEKKRGKEQLRIDEAREFLDRALAVLDGQPLEGRNGTQQRVAVLGAATALLLGFRNGEVVSRTVRDLDEGGRVLWVPQAKTRAGVRRVEVPDALQPYLLKLAEGRERTAQLFDGLTRDGLRYWTGKLCDDLKLPTVTPHGLRGTHATASMQPYANPHEVAAALGHTSFAVTERHYAKREAIADARQQAASAKLLVAKRLAKSFGQQDGVKDEGRAA
jgi:integrase